MKTKRGLQFLLTISLLLAAALPVRAHGSTSIELPIDTAAEAHAAVLAIGAPFGDFVLLSDELIGASQYYEVKGEPGSSATWIVVYTYGWGDCQAGCISRHTFVYQVDPVSGAVTFDSHQGDALPSDAPEGLLMIEALNGATGGIVPIIEVEPAPSGQPGSIEVEPAPSGQPGSDETDWAILYEDWYNDFIATLEPCAPDVDPADPMVVTCLLPDGSVAGPMPLFAPAPGPGPWPVDGGDAHGDDGWVHELPKIILAALLAWVGGAAIVGWRKSRANS
jgi:hypothetical protein